LLEQGNYDVESKCNLLEYAVIGLINFTNMTDYVQKDEIRSVDPATTLCYQFTKCRRGVCLCPSPREVYKVIGSWITIIWLTAAHAACTAGTACFFGFKILCDNFKAHNSVFSQKLV